jgi:hypothetical protein
MTVVIGYLAAGATKVDLQNQSRSVDFSAASSTKPAKAGTALPAVCSVGEAFVLTTAAAGNNFFICTATNTWSVQSGQQGPTGPAGSTGPQGPAGPTGSISSATSLNVGDGTVNGYIDLFPSGDTTHSIGFTAPSSRTTQVRLALPSADPAGQTLVCAAPASGVATCTWAATQGLTDPTTTEGDLLYRGATGLTRLGIGTNGQVLTSNGSAPAWTAPATGAAAANSRMTIDLPAGGGASGYVTGPWNLNGASGSINGGNYAQLQFAQSGSPSLNAQFRLPHNFDNTQSVNAMLTGVDVSGIGGTVQFKLSIACYAAGQSVQSLPTFGTQLVIGPITQNSNNGVSAGSASGLNLPSACAADVMAIVSLQRDNTVSGNLADTYGVMDLALTYGTK